MVDGGANDAVPPLLAAGVPMLKVSSKKIKPVILSLSPTTITWPSLKGGKIEIRAIRELRLGQCPTDAHDGARWITIVHVRDKQWKVVHFIAHTDDVYALWVRALQALVSNASDRVVPGTTGPATDPDLLFIRRLWPAGATAIDRSTAASLCAQLGLAVTAEHAARYQFPIDQAAFRQLVRDVQTRPDLEGIHQGMGGNQSWEQILAFFRDVQCEQRSEAELRGLFERYAAADGTWNAESLASFLASQDNVPTYPQDMTQPITEYYIASSHNTYLVAGQWRGDSTVEGYIRVLLAGCRCVEIDVHDGDNEPVVYHANTITSSVPIRDVCQAIKKYAFVTSQYPVVVSLEVHCTVEQQDRLSAVIIEVFGDLLVTEPLPNVEGIPSPEDLKGRILIKSKAHPSDQPAPLRMSPPTLSASPPDVSTDSTTTESDSSIMRLARRLSLNNPSKPAPAVSRSLSDLPIYTAGVKYRGFSKLVNYETRHMFSVSERTGKRIIRDGQEPDWIKHNFTHLSRVYPKGVRLGSSNFDPRPFWAAGAQMVAINYQTLDEGSLLNHALFHSSGYVLKPYHLRFKTVEELRHFRVRVNVISAQRLPPTGDLYVEGTVNEQTIKTKQSKQSTLNPRWRETLEFTLTSRPSELAIEFITLEIKARNTVAQWTRSIADAGRGYRYLPLEDSTRSRYLFATLFVRISVDDMGPAQKPMLTPKPSSASSRRLSAASLTRSPKLPGAVGIPFGTGL